MIIDVYGSTQSVQFVQEGKVLPSSSIQNKEDKTSLSLKCIFVFVCCTDSKVFYSADNVPAEILARGPEAVEAYTRLRKRGNAPLFRGRVVMLGQDRPSNIRFQRTLLNNAAAYTGEKGQIIECHHWCRINNKGQWKANCLLESEPPSAGNKKLLMPNLEADYDHAIARNIAMEIFKSKQKKALNKANCSSSHLASGAKRRMADISRSSGSFGKNALRTDFKKKGTSKVAPMGDNLTFLAKNNNVPANMIYLVENFLKELEQDQQQQHGNKDNTVVINLNQPQEDMEEANDITISFCKLGGHVDLTPLFFHFLPSEAVYLVTFDLGQDLLAPADRPVFDIETQDWVMGQADEMTNLDWMLNWINLIHHKSRLKNGNEALVNVIIVGTNRCSLHHDTLMQESLSNLKFETIRNALRGQPMENNVCQTYFAVDENIICSPDEAKCECQLCQMKVKLFHSLVRLPRMGMRIPISWILYENVIEAWLQKGIKFATMDEMFDSFEGQTDWMSFSSLLSLYCDLGLIFIVDKLVLFDTESFVKILAQLTSPFHFAQLVST